jgi:hypothetical protein
MPANDLIGAEVKVVADVNFTATGTTETTVDFGTPNDIYLPTHLTGKYHNADLLIVVTADAGAGTTDSLTFLVYDADDTDGGTTIGTPATAITNHPHSDYDLTQGTGDGRMVCGVQIQPGRPWLQLAWDASGATDTWLCHAVVLAIPKSV